MARRMTGPARTLIGGCTNPGQIAYRCNLANVVRNSRGTSQGISVGEGPAEPQEP